MMAVFGDRRPALRRRRQLEALALRVNAATTELFVTRCLSSLPRTMINFHCRGVCACACVRVRALTAHLYGARQTAKREPHLRDRGPVKPVPVYTHVTLAFACTHYVFNTFITLGSNTFQFSSYRIVVMLLDVAITNRMAPRSVSATYATAQHENNRKPPSEARSANAIAAIVRIDSTALPPSIQIPMSDRIPVSVVIVVQVENRTWTRITTDTETWSRFDCRYRFGCRSVSGPVRKFSLASPAVPRPNPVSLTRSTPVGPRQLPIPRGGGRVFDGVAHEPAVAVYESRPRVNRSMGFSFTVYLHSPSSNHSLRALGRRVKVPARGYEVDTSERPSL
ncbi:hypothetical protein EVAR_30399_1 [Eumeta japonica]|uniref:Uncharacterized protein n=1 Tax=Eumeta variegata TaxID=151549 RepID=A0A4C1W5S6_EUMVA|nr:hypothetical protein EVAR_30399_1 [Eumeta japonica]